MFHMENALVDCVGVKAFDKNALLLEVGGVELLCALLGDRNNNRFRRASGFGCWFGYFGSEGLCKAVKRRSRVVFPSSFGRVWRVVS